MTKEVENAIDRIFFFAQWRVLVVLFLMVAVVVSQRRFLRRGRRFGKISTDQFGKSEFDLY